MLPPKPVELPAPLGPPAPLSLEPLQPAKQAPSTPTNPKILYRMLAYQHDSCPAKTSRLAQSGTCHKMAT
jgi:hypothetical protein